MTITQLFRRPACVPWAAALIVSSAALAGPKEKTWVCHGTGSETNPYVLIHVSESKVQGHLDHTAPGHHGEHATHPDFLWVEGAHDVDCNELSEPLILHVSCGGKDGYLPAEGITFDEDGDPVSTFVDCPSAHGIVPLPEDVVHLRCNSGSSLAPYWQRYYYDDAFTVEFGTNCQLDDIVNLGVNGGPFQVVCPQDGEFVRYTFDFFGTPKPSPLQCHSGQILPDPSTGAATLFSWADRGFITGLVGCPSTGHMELHFPGLGLATDDPAEFVSVECAPGESFDLTRLDF